MKKTAIKGDKKKKKEVQEEVLRLESEMDKRHEEELAGVANNANVSQSSRMLKTSLQYL